MPKIPEIRRSQPRSPLEISDKGYVGDQVEKALVSIADTAFKTTQEIARRQIKVYQKAYASNGYSEDLIDYQNHITELSLKVKEDGSGYVDSVQKFLDEREVLRKKNAPTDEAYEMWNEKFNRLKSKALIDAQSKESGMRIASIKKQRNRYIGNFAQQMLVNPDIDLAMEYAREIENDIMDERGENYSDLEANEAVVSSKRLIFNSILDYYESSDQPEKVIALLKNTVPPKVFEDEFKNNKFNENSLPLEDPFINDVFGSSLTPSEKTVRFKRNMNLLMSKNTQNATAAIDKLKNVTKEYETYGRTPELEQLRDSVIENINRNNSITPQKKAKAFHDHYLVEGKVEALKDVSEMPIHKRNNLDSVIDEKIQGAKAKLGSSLIESAQYGNMAESEELASEVSASFYNMSSISAVKSSFKNSVAKDTKELIADGAIYFNKKHKNINNAGLILMDPDANYENSLSAFNYYVSELDKKYDYFGLSHAEKKYLTPNLKRFYVSEIMNQSTAEDSVAKIHELSSIFGEKSSIIFNELAKEHNLSSAVFSIAQVPSNHIAHVERLFNIIRDKEGFEKTQEKFDKRFGDQIDLINKIRDHLRPLVEAVTATDPSNRSLYITDGLYELMRLGAIDDTIKGLAATPDKALDKWKRVLLDPYKTIDINGSKVFTMPKTAAHHNDLEEFVRFANGSRNLRTNNNSVFNQLSKMGLMSHVVPDKNWYDEEADLNMPGSAEEKLNERIDGSIWIMTPAFDGIQLMHTDTGERRPFKDALGKNISIPLNRLNEITLNKTAIGGLESIGRPTRPSRFILKESSPIVDIIEAVFGED